MHKFIVLVILLSFSSAAFADLNLDHLSTTKLPPSENSELAANIFLLQLALKNKSENDELLGEGICIDYSKPNSADKDSTAQNFKIVTSNGVYASGSSRVDRNSPEFKKLKNLTGEMKKYFDTIGAGPRARTVGFTDGQHISGSSDQAAANKKLGQRRAVNIANALGIENFEADSFVSENGYELPQDQRECSKRRVTTIEFDAKPKLSFGQEHSYTPRFKMIKDHKATFNAVEHLKNTGCKNIAFISTHRKLGSTKKRKKGYLQALEEYKFPVNEELIIDLSDYNYKEYEKLLPRAEKLHGKESDQYANLFMNMGIDYYKSGDYFLSETWFLKSLAMQSFLLCEAINVLSSLNLCGTQMRTFD